MLKEWSMKAGRILKSKRIIAFKMNIENKFEDPNKVDIIDKIDDKLVASYNRLGECWQNKTYRPVKDLAFNSYVAAGLSAAATYSITGDSTDALLPFSCLVQALHISITPENTGSVYSAFTNLLKIPKRAVKGLLGILIFSGCSLTSGGLLFLTAGIINNEDNMAMRGILSMTQGISMLSYASGEYLLRSNHPKPPKRPPREKKEGLSKLIENVLPVPDTC